MANTQIRQSVLAIVNEVQRRLGVNLTASVASSRHSLTLLRLLNDVIDDLADAGDWQELYQEVTVTAQSSVSRYLVEASGGGLVRSINEVAFDVDVAPLVPRSPDEMRRLLRQSSFGRPRHFAVIGVDASSANPVMSVSPIPAANEAGDLFNITIFTKPNLLTTSDDATVPVFPANLLIQGLYAKALLDENGGEQSQEFATAFAEFQRMKREALNRFNSDTGQDLILIPSDRMRTY